VKASLFVKQHCLQNFHKFQHVAWDCQGCQGLGTNHLWGSLCHLVDFQLGLLLHFGLNLNVQLLHNFLFKWFLPLLAGHKIYGGFKLFLSRFPPFFFFSNRTFLGKVSTLSFGSFSRLKVLKYQLELNDNDLGLWTFILPLSLMSSFYNTSTWFWRWTLSSLLRTHHLFPLTTS